MKYAVSMLAGMFAFTGLASADVCGQLEQFAIAIETNTPTGLEDEPVLGAGETECLEMTGLEPNGLGGHRMGVSAISCYWENTDTLTYSDDDARDTAYHLHSCPVLIFDVLDQSDEGIQYSFAYADRTRILFGNDETGMFMDFFREE